MKRTKRAFNMKLKVFFIIVKVLSFEKIKHFFEGKNPTLMKQF